MNELYSASPPLDDAMRLRAAPATSWGAIIAGAVVAISVSIILVTLGSGLGFASVSPWAGRGLSAGSVTVVGAIWLIVTQWLSAAIGGYITGRLRHRWLATHPHEVFFRDTAHGLVTWAVATLVVVVVLASSVAGLLGEGARIASGAAEVGGHNLPAMESGRKMNAMNKAPEALRGSDDAYDLDRLFRRTPADPAQNVGNGQPRGDESRMEAMHIAAATAISGNMSDDDRSYLTNLVASKTGLSTDEAQKRVDAFAQSVNEATAKAKVAADKARKAAATAALYMALSLLIGAFIASVAAAIGGRLRDDHL